ncbi:MAG: Peptidase [Firmicutes bacterium]|nr:Peptidase [Bacillota bacterium]
MALIKFTQDFFRETWQSISKKKNSKKVVRSEPREYTLMLVPHKGHKVVRLRIPVKLVKSTGIVLCMLLFLVGGILVNYRNAASEASTEKIELERLRQINQAQNSQIEDLAKATFVLQDNMNRLNKLDTDIRQLVNNEDLPSSRGVGGRPGYGGQGGPVVKPDMAQLQNLVKEIKSQIETRENSLTSLKEMLVQRNARIAATPSIWPAKGEVTSRFGWRSSPWGGGGDDWHPGLDIAGDYGSPIVATADGTVEYSSWYSGYGNLVRIDHGNGIETMYGHCAQFAVHVGQQVKKGEVIAYMGSTGYSTGTHCHYEIRVNGTAVNPASFL